MCCQSGMNFRDFGEYYGYPKCCIESFIYNVVTNKPPSRTQKKASGRTGFIPCSYCSWKIKTNKVTLTGLISNRRSCNPFPIT